LFLGTLIALILEPLPVGAVSLLSLTTGLITHTISWQQGMAAVNNQVVWLIVVSFFMAKVEMRGAGKVEGRVWGVWHGARLGFRNWDLGFRV
jgi:di/tricarboxylate transporter